MATLDLGTLSVSIIAKDQASNPLKGTQKTLKDTETQAKTSAANINASLSTIGKGLSSVGANLNKFLTLPLLGAGAASFKLASDLSENVNKVDVVFKQNATTIKDWADDALLNMGMAESAALDMAAKFGDMGSSMGLNAGITKEYAMSLTQLTADLASFKNVSYERASNALTGIYTGETETLKQLGYVMTEVNLQEFAYSQGIKTKIKDMTQAEKVMLRYNYILNASKDAQGDFIRTQDGAANQMRIFGESLKELGATFGEVLLPTVTELIQKANDMLQAFGELDDETKAQIVNFALMAAAAGPLLTVVGKTATGIGNLTKATSSFKMLLTPTGALLGVVAAGVALWGKYAYEQYEKQTKLNNTLEKTNKLLVEGRNATADQIADAEKEQFTLEKTLNLHEQSAKALEANRDRQAEINEELNRLYVIRSETGGTAAQNAQIAALNEESRKLVDNNLELEQSVLSSTYALTEQYGTVEAAQGKLGALNKYVKDGAAEQKLLTKITDEATYSLNAEANALNESALKASLLVEEYKTLGDKKDKTADDTKRLVEIEGDLKSILGDTIVMRDKEGKAIGINLDLVNQEITANGNLSAAKKRAVLDMAEHGRAHVENTKKQVEAVIKALELEALAMEGRNTRGMKGYNDQAGMTTSERSYYNDQLNNVRANKSEFMAQVSEYKKLLSELDKVEATTTTPQGSGGAGSTAGAKALNSELEKAIDNFEKRKKVGSTSIDNEMYEIEVITKKYAKSRDEKIKMMEYELDNYLSVIERKKEANKLTVSQEIQLYEKARDQYAYNEALKVELDNKVKQLKLDNLKEVIDEGKYYNTLTLQQELEKYLELKELAKGHAEEVKTIDREIFRVKQSILDQEVAAVQKACDEQTKARQEAYNTQIEAIDTGLSDKLDQLQSELDKLDYEAEQERIAQDRQAKEAKVQDAEKKVQNAVTESERAAAVKELNEARKELNNFETELSRKLERQRIQEEMKAARAEAARKKKEAEAARDQELKELEQKKNDNIIALQKQHEAEYLLLTGKKGNFKTIEAAISAEMQTELDTRNKAFAAAQDKDVLKLQTVGAQMLSIAANITKTIQGQFNSIRPPSFIGAQYGAATPGQIAAAGAGPTSNTSNNSNMTINQYNTVNNKTEARDIMAVIQNALRDFNKSKGVK